ncbi:hypothetical protein Pla110_08510 [Polystyrenella longa]|uniref:Uncharacterized protein n=1 Tax=Polystyrenella longa TaxID=2528007 RepID=A0A518CIU1_9PLAN|nr:hypothetical protein [Polystyrenella longa]QDU79146.1 hypothetical protein Pla110_08510 [Polystyrenella longa]
MLNNPWINLPVTPPHVLQIDQDIVEQFNSHRSTQEKFKLQTHLYPEPFIGDPDSPVYFLSLNPGYSSGDDLWHRKPDFTKTLLLNLQHNLNDYPFYFFDPRYSESPGAGWWRRKSRWLQEEIGAEQLSNKVFWVELFPYHSNNYKPIPRSISPDGLVPSVAYNMKLVREAMLQQKLIVAMRSWSHWKRQIPELETYPNLLRLRSPQNVALPPNNVIGYDKLVQKLKEEI